MPHAAPVAKKSRCSDLPVRKQQTKNKRRGERTWERENGTAHDENPSFLFFFSKMFDATRQLKTRKYHLTHMVFGGLHSCSMRPVDVFVVDVLEQRRRPKGQQRGNVNDWAWWERKKRNGCRVVFYAQKNEVKNKKI